MARHTQISSLVASTPEFLATLPSFRAQSPPAIYRNVDQCATPISGSPPVAPMAPVTSGAVSNVERISTPTPQNVSTMTSPPAGSAVSPMYVGSGVSLPAPPPPADVALSYPSLNACATAPAAPSADTSPQHVLTPGSIQRSSSICETIVGGSYSSVALEMTRTESVPALAAYSSPLHDISAIPSSYALHQQQPQTLHMAPPYHISAAQSTFMATEACAAQSAVPMANQTDGPTPQSPLRMAATLPVYSGFAQLTTDGVRNAEESNAKQFFYQNW